jgi:recombinational DNA repair protein (RecF pathway)
LPAAILQTEVLVLLKRPPAESYQSCTLFSPEHGVLSAFIRVPRTSAPKLALDLFDEASITLESSNQGRTWFVRDGRVLHRAVGIGRSYEALRAASVLAALIARNPPAQEGRAPVSTLLRTSLDALASGGNPDVVLFKSVYRYARDEGYPVKEEWLPGLPAAERADAERLLRTPLADLEPAAAAAAAALQPRLDAYLRHHTEILLD